MKRRHFRNFVFFPFAILTGLITALWLASPFIVKHYLTAYFLEQGQNSSIEKLSIDFFPPKIDLKNIVINNKNQDTLILKRAIFEVEIWPLLAKTVYISEAKIDGLNLFVGQQKNHWMVAGIDTDQYLTQDTKEEPKANKEEATQSNSPWKIKLPSFSITDSQVNVSRQQDLAIPAESDTFSLLSLSLKDLSGQALNWQGSITLSALVNQAALSINSDFDYTPEQASADIRIKNTRLPLESFHHFLPTPFNEGKGQLNLDGAFTFQQKQVNDAPVFAVNNLNLDAQIEALDLKLNETDSLTTKSTALKLTQSTIEFASVNQLAIAGELDLQSTESFFTQAGQVIQFGELTLNLPFDIKRDELGLTAKSTTTQLDMLDLSIALDSLAVENQKIQIALSDLNLTMDPQKALIASLSTQIHSNNLSVLQAGNTAHYDTFNLSDSLSVKKTGANIVAKNTQLDINIKGLNATQIDDKQFSLDTARLTAEQLNVHQEDGQKPMLEGVNLNFSSQLLDSMLSNEKRIASWKSADIDSLSFTQQDQNFDVQLNQLNLVDLTLSQPLSDPKIQTAMPPLSHIGSIKINDVDANQDGAKINSITTDSVNISLIIDKQKRLENLVFISAGQQQAPETALKSSNTPREKDVENTINEQKSAFKAPYYVVLETYDTTGTSSINVQDKSISPTLQRSLEIDTLSLRKLNTQKKDQATVLALKARNGKYATLQSDITIWPLADRLTMKSELIIKEAELPPYSSYIASVLGYQIDSGQLDLDLKLTADAGVLDGNSHIILREFDLGGRKDSSSVIKAGAIPLNIAVSILKDSKNNIDLEIPLSGDIDNPEFGWQNFLLLPVRKALFTASSSYLMQTFVPYANVISIAQFAGDQLLKIRVEPLIFEATDSYLNASQDVFLKQLIALMQDKKDSQLKACGVASYLDLGFEKPPVSIDQATKESAEKLAQERADHLKDHLVKEGISSSRIYLCSPEIDLSTSSKPRVELNF